MWSAAVTPSIVLVMKSTKNNKLAIIIQVILYIDIPRDPFVVFWLNNV